jgi:transcriptional regulator with XRE-family HTH domain
MSVPKAFGIVLRRHRKAKGWSQEQLALEAGHERVFISWLENAKNQPTISTIFTLAKALEVKPSQFIRDVENEISASPARPSAKQSRKRAK